MIITSVSNPAFADADSKSVRCTVTFDTLSGPYAYTAADGDADSQSLFNSIIAGDHGAVAAFVAAPPASLASLKQATVSAGSAYADAIVGQVTPTVTRQAAFQNAAGILAGSGGSAPTSGPYVDAFAALASSYGISASAFATVVMTAQNASLQIETAMSSFDTEVITASTTAQIVSAIAAFEGALASVISRVNAVMPSPVTTPPPISIPGVNA
jgi:hypothetical protein